MISLDNLKYDFEEMTGNIPELQADIETILKVCYSLTDKDFTISADPIQQNIIYLELDKTIYTIKYNAIQKPYGLEYKIISIY